MILNFQNLKNYGIKIQLNVLNLKSENVDVNVR